MSFGIYKRGQGKWSRGIGAISLSAMGIWGAIATYGWLKDVPANLEAGKIFVGYWVPGLILAIFLAAAYFVSNQKKSVNLLIDTETEMKKVTWPTPREVLNATVVVIVVVIVMGLFLFSVDRVLIQPLYRSAGLLPGTPFQEVRDFIVGLFE